jgi:hypothetical protein
MKILFLKQGFLIFQVIRERDPGDRFIIGVFLFSDCFSLTFWGFFLPLKCISIKAWAMNPITWRSNRRIFP